MLQSLLYDARLLLTLILVSLILLIADGVGILNFPKGLLQSVTSPVQLGLYKTSLSFGKQFEFIFLTRKIYQENKALNEQIAQILSENANLRRKLAETQGFLDQQHSLDLQTYNLVPARPIGISRYLLIDKGSEDGLKMNQAVIYKDNYIGKIIEVGPKKSKVLVPTDPDSHISAFVNNPSGKAKGILSGQFGSDMLLDKVLHEEPISKQDLVYTEGTETEIPRGLILGQVSEVLDKANDVFKQAKVKSIFEATNLDIVFVVTN